MDPLADSPPLQAPGEASPSTEPFGVDDRLVVPETTREEMLDGRRILAAPAEVPHADPHCRLDYLLSAHIKPDYVAATDLLTRVAGDSDFASDTCVRRRGTDPHTGQRYLEEVAFEIVHKRARKEDDRRVALMVRRGVRRVFAIFVLREAVAEYDPARGAWRYLAPEACIDDPCFIHPLPVRALLDPAAADAAVVAALEARGEPALQAMKLLQEQIGRRQGEAEGRRKGEAEGRRKGASDLLARQLELRFGTLPVAVRRRVEAASDDELSAWSRAILEAASLAAVFEDTGPHAN